MLARPLGSSADSLSWRSRCHSRGPELVPSRVISINYCILDSIRGWNLALTMDPVSLALAAVGTLDLCMKFEP